MNFYATIDRTNTVGVGVGVGETRYGAHSSAPVRW